MKSFLNFYSLIPSRLIRFSCLLLLFSCENTSEKPIPDKNNISKNDLNKKIEQANKIYVKRESDEIDQYIILRGWEMITTGTGLRYMILKKGNGKTVLPGMEATINYKVKLLDGTLCYSSDSLGSKTFLVEQDNVESGLHEGIQKLREGDVALFILPSHIAHGLLGDDSLIPSHASVVYEIELLSVQQ